MLGRVRNLAIWRRKRIARRSLVWSGRSRECKRRTSVCDGSWKRPCERPSDRRRRFSGEIGKRIPEKRDGKQARTTGCRCRREIPDRVEEVVEVALPGRGFRPAAAVLGAGFDGFLVRDGWSVYRQFAQALHQSCLAPLLRCCRKMIQAAGPGVAEAHALPGQPALGESHPAGTECRLHVPVLSRIGSDQLEGRTSHPPDGGHAQSLGSKPHGGRGPGAKHLAPYPANLPPAEPPRATTAGAFALFASTTVVGFGDSTPPFTLNSRLSR